MLVNVLGNPVGLFLDSNGAPLQGGSVYIGQPNTDPTNSANWIAVYQDQGLSIPLQQPIKTTNGQPSLNGQQIPVYLGLGVTTYSLAALNAGGVVVMSQPNVAPFSLGGSASGSMVVKEFVSGTDFTGGTTTSLPLSANFGSGTNLWVDFDGVPQHYPDDFTLSGTTLTFTAPIPVGVQKVFTKGGTTAAIGTPAAGTVTDAAIAAATKLFNRLNDFIDLRDPAYGAKCDGVTDDTAAVQRAINAIGSNAATLIIPGPTLISGALTFGLNTVLWPVNGGYLIGKVGTEVVTVQQTPFAGPVAVFKNCAPIATVGMNVMVEWFAAVADNATINTAAFNAAFAFLKNTGGLIQMQAGTYKISGTIVNNGSHITLQGVGINSTMISMTSATIDGIHNYGVSGTPLANCQFRNFGIICSAAGSSTGSYGIDLQYNAFTVIENVQVQEFLYGIDLIRATNTQLVQVGSTYVSGATNGFIGFNFNGGGTGTGGNASTTLRNCYASGNNTLTGSIGFKLTGIYMSDLFFENCETAGTNYGYYFDYATATFFEDIIISRPIVDQFTTQGIFVANMPIGGKLTIMGGWINPKAAAASVTDIYISACQGNITVNGAQIVGDANIANTTGVQITNSTGVTLSANQITNTHIGVNMSGSGYNNIVGNGFKNDATAALYYISGTGDARTMVNGNSFQGFATTGVAFDVTSSGSAVVGNTFRVTNIGTRVSNNATTAVGAVDGSTGLNTGF